MSQSTRVSSGFGGIKVYKNGIVKVGNTTQVNVFKTPAPTALSTTATTITAAQVTAGLVTQTPASALTVTLPSASAFLAAMAVSGAVEQYDSFKFTVINLSGANILTVAVDGSTGTLVGAAAIAVSTSAEFLLRVTSVSGSPTYTVYRV